MVKEPTEPIRQLEQYMVVEPCCLAMLWRVDRPRLDNSERRIRRGMQALEYMLDCGKPCLFV